MVISDSASNLIGYYPLFQEILRKIYMTQNIDTLAIKCLFIPYLSLWWGGFYERLDGLIKHLIKKYLGRKIVNWPIYPLLTQNKTAVK